MGNAHFHLHPDFDDRGPRRFRCETVVSATAFRVRWSSGTGSRQGYAGKRGSHRCSQKPRSEAETMTDQVVCAARRGQAQNVE